MVRVGGLGSVLRRCFRVCQAQPLDRDLSEMLITVLVVELPPRVSSGINFICW